MPYNKTAWRFIGEAEVVIADYIRDNVSLADRVAPGLTSGEIKTHSISVRNTNARPYTNDAAIVAHMETTTVITIRTAVRTTDGDESRYVHQEIVSEALGCLMIVDEVTGENALHDELNGVDNDYVQFSMASVGGISGGVDDANHHLITRIEINAIINPKQIEA